MNKTFTKSFIALVAMFVFALSVNAKNYKRQDAELGKQFYIYCPASQKFFTVTDANADFPDYGVWPTVSATSEPTTLWTIGETDDAYSLSIKLGGETLYLNYGEYKMNTYVLEFSDHTWDIDIRNIDGYYTISRHVGNDGYLKIADNVGNDKDVSIYSKFIFVSADLEEVPSITLDEEATSVPANLTDDETDVKVNRTMSTGKWNSLSLPFSLTADEVKANFGSTAKVMKMTDITAAGEVQFADATTIDACQMYIVNPTSNVAEINAEGKTGIKTAATSEEEGGMQIAFGDKSNYSYIVAAQPICQTLTKAAAAKATAYILSNNKFYLIDSNITIKGFRWGILDAMKSEGEAKKLTLNLNGEITSISEIEEGIYPMVNGACFNLQGQRVNANAKGIIIKNGKKYINK